MSTFTLYTTKSSSTCGDDVTKLQVTAKLNCVAFALFERMTCINFSLPLAALQMIDMNPPPPAPAKLHPVGIDEDDNCNYMPD